MIFHKNFTNLKDIDGLVCNENKKILQNNPSNVIILDKKLANNFKFPDLNVIKIAKKCNVESLYKKDWTNLEKKSLYELGMKRQTRLHVNKCFAT